MTPTTRQVEVLAIGAHPDDVELGCGGTLALLVAQGYRVGILHLTRGERGTRGTLAEREAEARAAGAALGVDLVEFLDCGDGAFRHGEAEEDALIAVLRRLRPELILGPTPNDRHPDHGRAHQLVADAAFYAGLARRAATDGRAPHRPAAVFSYLQHDLFTPSLVVDVSQTFERKLAALRTYSSQLYQPDQPRAEPLTKVASPEFWHAVEGRARHFGLLIGVAFGEPFFSRTPLAVHDLMTLLPTGLR